ncbi:unnamed protein product [Durusdinium trenchii]
MVTFYRQHLLAAMLSCWQQDAVRGSEKKRHAGPQMATWKRAVAEFAVFGRRRRFFQLWREARRCRALDAGVWQRAGRSRRGAPWRLWMAWRCFARGRRRTAEQGRQVQSLRGGTWLLQRHLARWRMAAAGRWQCQRRRERRTRLLLHAWRRWVTSARQLEGMLSHRVVLQEGRLLQRTLQRWQWEVRSRVVARGIQAKRRHLWKISLLSAWREECQRLQLLRVVWTCWLRHRQQERHGRALRVLGPFMAAWRGHGHAREGLRRRAAEHLLQALAKTREQLRDLAFVLWAQRTARAAEQRGQLWHLEAQRSAGVLKHCLRCWLHVLRAHQGERRRAKDALLACARGWRTLTEHGLHSRRSERAVVAWRFLLLDLLEYARPARA